MIILSLPLRAADIGNGSLAYLLERTGQRVKQFWGDLSSVACTETLLQEKLDQKDKVVLNNRGVFDYLISLGWNGSTMMVDESRIPVGGKRKKTPQGVLLATQGFATLLLIFHPEFQRNYTFSLAGEDEAAGKKLVRVAFLPRKGADSPSVLRVKGRDYPIGWEGTAWIDPDEARITRMETAWKDPAEEIGLQALSSQVQYSPIYFQQNKQSLWLPELAQVDLKTLHQHWRNTHRFSGYRLFSVETETKMENVKK
jgi:hypothetical protein